MKIMMNANLDELTDGQLQRVQVVSEENQIVVARTREEQLAHAPDVDIIFGNFSRPLFEAARSLKWVQTEGAGIDSLLFEEFVEGPIVDTTALLEALDQGTISGAGLDVTPQEPLAADSPLWDHPHVIITPHASGGSPLRLDRTIDLFCENLRRFTDGRPLVSVIDKRKGY